MGLFIKIEKVKNKRKIQNNMQDAKTKHWMPFFIKDFLEYRGVGGGDYHLPMLISGKN